MKHTATPSSSVCKRVPVQWAWRVLLLTPFILLFVSCSAPRSIQFEEESLVPADIDAEVFFDKYAEKSRAVDGVSGRANAQVNEPGVSERATISFQSSRSHSVLSIRNNLGMEGGRIYSNPDSVIIYNRIEKTAHKMSQEEASSHFLNGITAMNILAILHPIEHASDINAIYSNDFYYLVETKNGFRHLIEKEGLVLRRSERTSDTAHAYSTFIFESFATVDGIQLPRRIQILSSDEKSNIFLFIRAFEINPSAMNFEPDIPEDTEIIRI
ncbi:DUF4292 domain-containing protein [Balneolaceae bacterium ANBcel3]|nr:DUF4292 domain-containing protein [Balneolaceae bacterium ANBcel3]